MRTLRRSILTILLLLITTGCGLGGGLGSTGGSAAPPVEATGEPDARLVRALEAFVRGGGDPSIHAPAISSALAEVARQAPSDEYGRTVKEASYAEVLRTENDFDLYADRTALLSGYAPATVPSDVDALEAPMGAASAPSQGSRPILAVFVNGIFNDQESAEEGTLRLSREVCDILPYVEVTYCLTPSTFHASKRLVGMGSISLTTAVLHGVRDAWKSFLEGNIGSWEEAISTALEYTRTPEELQGLNEIVSTAVTQGRKVLLVAHSEGNAVVRDLLTLYQIRGQDDLRSHMAVLMLGSPVRARTIEDVLGSSTRVRRLSIDRDILSYLPATMNWWTEDAVVAAPHSGPWARFRNHQFVDGYLSPASAPVLRSLFEDLARRLDPSVETQAPSGIDLRALPSCEDDGPRVQLHWSCVEDVIHWSVFRDGALLGEPLPPWQLSYEDTSAVAGESPTYYVRAVRDPGGVQESVRLRVELPLGLCEAPRTFELQEPEVDCDGSSPLVRLRWSAASGTTNYRIVRDGLAYGPLLGASARAFTNTEKIASGETHDYAVMATNASGWTSTSTRTVSIPFELCGDAQSPPGSFSIRSLTSSCSGSSPRVVVAWEASLDAASYRVYRDGSAITSNLSASATSYADSSTSAGSRSYRVRATNARSSTWSPTRSVTVSACSQPATERVTNGSFTSGSSGWTRQYDFWIDTDGSYPYSSPGYAAGGVSSAGYAKNGAVGWMYQNVAIPSGATTAKLSFRYNISSDETASTAYDVLNVTIKSSAGSYLATVLVKSNKDKGSPGSYRLKSFDLAAYKGRTIQIHFLATSDSSRPTIFRIDNVSVMADG